MKVEYRHSASKTNTFIDSPPFWIINELFDFESEPNARMKMGLTAEDAAHYAISNQINDENNIAKDARIQYVNKHQGVQTDDECEWSGIIAYKFVENLYDILYILVID